MDNPGCQAFFDALVDGRLKLGQTLTLVDLGAVLGLTLSRIRDVVVLLEAEGLVEIRKRLGVTIFYPDVQMVGNTFQFREILEREGLRKFVGTVSDGWIADMEIKHRQIIDFVRANPDPRDYAGPVRALEREFHDSFIRSLGNERVAMNHRRNSQLMFLLRLLNPDAVGPRNTVTSMTEHQAIIEALGRRNTEDAVEGLERHMKGVLHRILTH